MKKIAPKETKSEDEQVNTGTNSDASLKVEPYTASYVTFSEFSSKKYTDGYTIELKIENTDAQFEISLGRAGNGGVILNTDQGEFSAAFPHMETIDPSVVKTYSFNFKQATGTPETLTLSNVYLLNDSGLPRTDIDNNYTIPLR